MPQVKRIVLDVLKPHQPNALEFAKAISLAVPNCRVTLKVSEIDERTASTIIIIEAGSIDFEGIEQTISSMGGAVHSIDEVEVVGQPIPES